MLQYALQPTTHANRCARASGFFFLILTFVLPTFGMTSIFLLSFLYDLVDFISILSPCDTLVRKLMYIRQRIESASEIPFPSSWIGLIDSRSVATAVWSPPFENASVPIAIPALPRSVLPRDFKNSFAAVLPL